MRTRAWAPGQSRQTVIQKLDQMLLSPPMMTRRIFALVLNNETIHVLSVGVKRTVVAKNIRNACQKNQGAMVPAMTIAKGV